MDRNIPTYLINFDPDKFESGIDLIAVTETPAIETLSLRFSEVAKMTFKYNEDQQLIIGPAIIPDKPIYRNDNGHEYYVVFTKEVIEKMVEKFNSEQRYIKFNIEHDENFLVEGFIKESWLVEDENIDKSKLYGFSVPVGTWMISAKFTDKEVWDTVIKQMDNVGFSIEGLMGIEKTKFFRALFKAISNSNSEISDNINQNKIEKMSKTNKTKKLKFVAKRVSSKKKFNVSTKKFEEILVTSEEDEVLIVPELAEGAPVEILDESGEVVTAEDGTFEIPSEEVVVEVAEGEIVAIDEAPAAEAPAEEEALKKNKLEDEKEDEEEKEKMEVDPETLAKIVELESRLDALEAKLAEGEVIEENFKKTTRFSKDASKAERLAILSKLVK